MGQHVGERSSLRDPDSQPPKDKRNWIRTVPGKGWFPFFRFYGPTEPYFDQTGKLDDILRTEP
jgi:hypothetical protein